MLRALSRVKKNGEMARNGDPAMALHSAAAAVISQQPHPGQELWFSGGRAHHLLVQQQQHEQEVFEEGRQRRQRAVILVVIVSVASFVRRILMLFLGLLRLSYRKVGLPALSRADWGRRVASS